MWMDAQRNVGGDSRHLDRKYSFGDHFSRSHTDNANAEHAFRVRIEDQLRHSLRTIKGYRASGRSPGEFRNFDLAIFFLCLRFRQTAPSHFRISEHDSRDGMGFEGNFVSSDGFDRGPALVRSLVRKHRLADDISDRIDRRIVGLPLFVYLNESALTNLHPCLLKSWNFGIRLSSHRHQHAIKDFFLSASILRRESRTNTVSFVLYRSHSRIQQNAFEHLLQP